MTKQNFISLYLADADVAGSKYRINPAITWGSLDYSISGLSLPLPLSPDVVPEA